MEPKDKIEQILKRTFTIEALTVIDDSLSHAGHNPDAAKGGTHFTVSIISPDFEGKTLVERHRMINSALRNEFKDKLHALAIKAKAPGE